MSEMITVAAMGLSHNQTNNSLITESLAKDPPQISETIVIRSIILLTMACLSAITNSWTIWNIHKSRVAKKLSLKNYTAIYLLIFHLCVADLLVTSFCMVGDAIWALTVQWLAGGFMCKLIKFAQMFSLYLSTYILVLIGLDRLMAVKYPMKIINMGRQIRMSLICVYSLSAIFSIPQIFIFSVESGPFTQEFKQCVTHGFYKEQWQEQLYTGLTLLLMFAIPLVILLVTYLMTFRSISYSERKLFPSDSPIVVQQSGNQQGTIEQVGLLVKASYKNRARILHRAKYKSLRLSVLIILAFIICWTPYYILMVTVIFTTPDEKTTEILESVIFFFGMSNSLINPLIYGVFHLMPKRRKFFNSFQTSQTRTGIAVGEISHNLIASNKKLISRIGSSEGGDGNGCISQASAAPATTTPPTERLEEELFQ